MRRSKKIFIFCIIIFVLAVAYIAYDIASRTTFPGAKESVKEKTMDSLSNDTMTVP